MIRGVSTLAREFLRRHPGGNLNMLALWTWGGKLVTALALAGTLTVSVALATSEAFAAPLPEPPPIVRSVEVRGEAMEDRVALVIRYEIAIPDPRRSYWAVIRLDGRVLERVYEGDRDLAARVGTGDVWEVEIPARTRTDPDHVADATPNDMSTQPASTWSIVTVTVELNAPTRLVAEGRALDLAIPEAAMTRLDLTVPGRIAKAVTSDGQPLPFTIQEPIPTTPTTPTSPGAPAASPTPDEAPAERATSRLTARLTPRARLEVRWSTRDDSSRSAPVRLAARALVEATLTATSCRALATFEIGCLSGAPEVLRFDLDPDLELLSVRLDGQTIARAPRVESTPNPNDPVAKSSNRIEIRLPEPMLRGGRRVVALTVRRPFVKTPVADAGGPSPAAEGSTTLRSELILRLPRPVEVLDLSGSLAVNRGEDLWFELRPLQGLRVIDPATELPPELKSPETNLGAFRFDEPFEIAVTARPVPARTLVETASTLTIGRERLAWSSRATLEMVQGGLSGVTIALPEGFQPERVGPSEIVRRWSLETSATGSDGQRGGARSPLVEAAASPNGVSRIELEWVTGSGRDRSGGVSPESRQRQVEWQGHMPRPDSSAIPLPFWTGPGLISRGGRLLLVAEPGLDLIWNDPDGTSGFVEEFTFPANWPGPRPPADRRVILLRHDGPARVVKVGLRTRPPRLELDSDIRAQVDPQTIRWTQTLNIRSQGEGLTELNLSVPHELVEAIEFRPPSGVRLEHMQDRTRTDATRENATATNSSASCMTPMRLEFAAPAIGEVSVRFDAVLPWESPLEPGRPRSLVVPLIRGCHADVVKERLAVELDPRLRGRLSAPLTTTPAGWRIETRQGNEGDTARGHFPLSPPSSGSDEIDRVSVEPSVSFLFRRGRSTLRPSSESPSESSREDHLDPPPPQLMIELPQPAELPAVRIERCDVRQAERSDGVLWWSMRLTITSHPGTIEMILPLGSQPRRCEVAGRTVGPERVGNDRIRLALPPGRVRVEFEAIAPPGTLEPWSEAQTRRWPLPRVENASFGRVRWFVSTQDNHVVLGVPAGWSDANEWRWSGLGWSRMARLDPFSPELNPDSSPVSNSAASPAASAPIGELGTASANDTGSRRETAPGRWLAFERTGDPLDPQLMEWSRLTFLGGTAALILGVGMWVATRPRFEALTTILGLLSLVALTIRHPESSPAYWQAAALGGGLLAAVRAIQARVKSTIAPRRPASGESPSGSAREAVGSGGASPSPSDSKSPSPLPRVEPSTALSPPRLAPPIAAPASLASNPIPATDTDPPQAPREANATPTSDSPRH